MGLQDEMTFQRIEVLLDMQAKKISAEITKLRDELSQAKEELRKEIHAVRQDASYAQAGAQRVQMYADAPPHQEPQPVPRYAQEQAPPQWGGPQHAQGQQWGQQAPPQPAWMAAAPPQMRGGDKPVETRPIDRNGVAPSDISVEKFFYFGNKK
jgi:hypothetical protein